MRFLDGVGRNDRETHLCKMHICWSRFLLEIFIITCSAVFWIAPEVELKCAGLESPFDILPEGDHIIENGSVLELFCKLNTGYPGISGYSARDLNFWYNNRGRKVLVPNTTILNETTIKIDLISPPLGSTLYYCTLNGTKYCLTSVQVGYKPQPVLNFQCTSYNWEVLYCHWTPPENPIKTEYSLTYTLPGLAGKTPRLCPNHLDVENNSCIYNFETSTPYRQSPKNYFFNITGKNALGVYSEIHKFRHFAHVIPNKPENVTVVNKTVGAAVIRWNIPLSLYHFPPGLRFKIEFRNQWEDWKEVNDTQDTRIYGENYTYSVSGLNYSHTEYEVRIYLKSFDAKIGPEEWSQPASVKFTTPSTVPGKAPLTTQGSFEVVSSGNGTDVFIYWARISKNAENGGNFTYDVKCTSDDGGDCEPPIDKSDTFAMFPISGLHSYTFSIYSVNEVGRSEETSYVFVPKFGTFIKPERFTKVAYDHGVFELSWKPVDHRDLSNYTIFWCKEDKDLPVPCKGHLDWITVPKDATSKNITIGDVTKFYKFAIAVNLINGTSSGMIWSDCVIYHDKVLKKIDDFHISRVESREVDVLWEIRCPHSSVFKGFAFYYCPVDASSRDDSCIGNSTEEVTKLNGSQERNITLRNLRPHTTYKLQISIILLDGSQQIQMGPKSDSKRFSTLEDAPSTPLNVMASSVTNHSVLLSWGLPEEANGVLQTYELSFEYPGGEKHVKFDAQSATGNSIVNKYEVRDLVSFTTYNFTLKVCTSPAKCSDYSEPAMVTTLIGPPNKMLRPQVSIVNSTMADISWELPVPAAGPLNFYQLSITVDGESTVNEVFNLTGSSAKIPVQACKVKYNTPEFRIRAINIDQNSTSYYGPWSEATQIHCGGSSGWNEKTVLIDWLSGTCTLFVVSVCVFYIVKKGWLQCRKMKDVEVKLPPGLQSQDLEKDNQDYLHLERWPPRSPETVGGSVGTVLAPDEESLLDKKSDESIDITSFNMPMKNGGDSSGCCVGRESVSSSITSDTHVSSDSGAETDQCMIKSSTFEPWNSSDKRNPNNDNGRNPSPKRVLNFTGLGDWDLNESAIPGYTKVGFTSCFVPEKNLPSKGYVTIANVTCLTNPQKTNNECNGNALTAHGFVTPSEDPFPSDSGLNNINNNSTSNSTPRYVSLAQFEGQKMGVSSVPTNLHNGESSPKESPKLSRLDVSLEQDDEKTEDSVEEDFSGTETETDTIHEVPIPGNTSIMPPYVSMVENPTRNVVVDVEEEEEEEEEETDEEDARLSREPNDLSDKNTVNGIGSVLPDKMNKDSDSFPNYIPHHLFGKESVQT